METCPVCGAEVEEVYRMPYDKPWVSVNPMEGLTVYGPYSSDKGKVCKWEENGP